MTAIERFLDCLMWDYEKEAQKPFSEQNILPPSTDAHLVVMCMKECFLQDDWILNYSAGNEQTYTEICMEILYKHSKKFRRMLKKRIKEMKQKYDQ